jgi:hypothetical protein
VGQAGKPVIHTARGTTKLNPRRGLQTAAFPLG